MTQILNEAFLRFSRRAETEARETLVETFVDTGLLTTMLQSRDHSIIYGRRGTGKTHALAYLTQRIKARKDIAINIDARSLGSNGGIYSDPSVPLAERGTRLLVDVLHEIHNGVLDATLDDGALNLSEVGAALDNFMTAINDVRISGEVQKTEADFSAKKQMDSSGASVGLSSKGPAINMKITAATEHAQEIKSETVRRGSERLYVHFGSVGNAMGKVIATLKGKRVWVLIDEWSTVPLDLQPYLADLLRRSLFALANISFKIAAIEHRSEFQLTSYGGEYVGIEVGADASADVNLDDFMVFENDATKAIGFFKELIYRHYVSAAEALDAKFVSADELTKAAFTDVRAVQEFVRAAEGVPRDAVNILGICAQRAGADKISVAHVRAAAKSWYERDKGKAVGANADALSLLHWIIDEVIAHRSARAFLLRVDKKVTLIDQLFDSRVLHILKRSVSSPEEPGVRYVVYKIDYGCYVDLLATSKEPAGLLPSDDGQFVVVPPDDYRAIRRAILKIEEFEPTRIQED